MSVATTLSPIDQFIETVLAQAQQAKAQFGALSEAQLNWQPSAEQWSVAQCLDHLINTDASYLPAFQKLAAGDRQQTLWQRMPVLGNFFGRMVINALAPTSTKKFKAPANVRPASSKISGDIVTRFVKHQQQLAELVHKLKDVPLSFMLTSPISPLVTYSVGDSLIIMNRHTARHFGQAERVTNSPGFPVG